MIFTALLSGVFGMAGGLILIGVLLVVMPLPQAMVLHAVTQMASNGWRAILWWRHIEWKIAAASIAGSVVAVGLWSLWLYVPDKAVALLLLGLSPFIVRAIPASVLPKTLGPGQMLVGSAICMMLMLTAGVTGPLLDTLFLRSPLERRQIIATKAACQLFSHSLKLVYFGLLIDQVGLGRAVASGHRRRLVDDRHLAGQAPAREAHRPAVPQLVEPHHHRDRDLLCRLRPGADGGDRLDRSFPPNASRGQEFDLQWRVSIPPGFRELTEATGFAAANGPWFEKIESGRAIRGFLPGPQHANALGIVHGGMLAAFLDSAMGTAVWHGLQRRAVTLRLSLDYLGPARIGDWLQAEGDVVGHDELVAQVRGRLYGPRHEVLAGLGAFSLLSRHRTLKTRS